MIYWFLDRAIAEFSLYEGNPVSHASELQCRGMESGLGKHAAISDRFPHGEQYQCHVLDFG